MHVALAHVHVALANVRVTLATRVAESWELNNHSPSVAEGPLYKAVLIGEFAPVTIGAVP